MKVLVVYYSRHGHTKTVAGLIASKLSGDIEELIDLKDRSSLISWNKSAFDEELRTPTQIAPPKFNSKNYDLVIIGTPMWDGINPAVKVYIAQNSFKKVAFFATFGAASEDAFYDMEKIIGKKPIATLEIQDRQIALNEHKEKINAFCKEVKKGI